ncbi:MAG: hypothetical protein ACRC3J_05985 [Culicoidibacterales bacterium]
MYKILYRSMFIILTIVALFYLGFGFMQYVDAQNQLLTADPPSVQIEKFNTDNLNDPYSQQYFNDQFKIQPLAPTTDLDTLWQTGLYLQLAQGIITFSLALATTIFGLFALSNRKIFAILATIFLSLAYLADEVFSFLRLGIYGLGTYNVYLFNILEIAILVTLLGMCWFTITHFYAPIPESQSTTNAKGGDQS